MVIILGLLVLLLSAQLRGERYAHQATMAAYAHDKQLWQANNEAADRAIKALNYCLSKNEYNAAAWEALGCAWMRKNELERAADSLDMAIKLEPENWSVKRNIGVLNILKRDYKKARELQLPWL